MSVSNELQRIANAKNTIKAKLVEFGLTTEQAENTIDQLADILDDVEKLGENVNILLDTASQSYRIPAGYHDGKGLVAVSCQSKQATPTKNGVTVYPDTDHVLAEVVVAPIPDTYLDTTDAGVVKDSDDLHTDGATVIVTAGYYPDGAEKSVMTVDRAKTNLTIIKSDENDLQIKASNVQGTGYVVAGDDANDYEEGYVNIGIEGRIAKAWVEGSEDQAITAEFPLGSYSVKSSVVEGEGDVDANSNNVTIIASNTQPTSGYYITVRGSGSLKTKATATIDAAGYLEEGIKDDIVESVSSGTKTKWYTVQAANVPTSINPLTQSSVSVTEGYTKGGTVTLTNDLENALKSI